MADESKMTLQDECKMWQGRIELALERLRRLRPPSDDHPIEVLFPDLTTLKQYAPLIHPRLETLLARLELAHRRGHRPDALSGGEQQRVAIARALIADPSIILADEPTGSLDSVTVQSICRLLRQLCKEQGRTIVLVTHEPSAAVTDRRRGRRPRAARPGAAVARPAARGNVRAAASG